MPYSMQLTEQIPNDPRRMGAKSTTTSNHPSTPSSVVQYMYYVVQYKYPVVQNIYHVAQYMYYVM